MADKFSFLGDDFENLLRYSELFLPGIEKMMAIYSSKSNRQINILSRHRDEEIEWDFQDLLSKPEIRVIIQKFRSQSKSVAWIRQEEMPFEVPVKKTGIPSIFTEFENVILVLGYPSEADGKNDLVFIYFNNNLSSFGLNRADKPLSTENKSIIGHLLYHQFRSVLKMNLENLKLLQNLNRGVHSVINRNAVLKDQFRELQMNYSDSMVNLVQQFLADYSTRTNKTYILTHDAIEKIRNFHGNVKHLTSIAKNAIVFTENLMLDEDPDVIKLHDYSLDFESYQTNLETDQATRRIDSRQSKAMMFLDKLEKSAISLKSRNISLTGAHVGKNFNPPISAPAITDALSKYKDLIRQLILRHPDKWELIRSEFRPLINILREKSEIQAQEESA